MCAACCTAVAGGRNNCPVGSLRSQNGLQRAVDVLEALNIDGKKKILIRNFYLSDREDKKVIPPKYKSKDVPMLITNQEKEMMERNLARWRKVQKEYRQADEECRDMSFEEYQRYFIDSLDEREREVLLTQTVDEDDPNMLDDYDFDVTEYALHEVEYPERGRSRIQLTKIYNLPPFMKKEQETADLASVSRHFFGALISSDHQNEIDVYEMQHKEGKTPSETTFLIRSNVKDSENDQLHHERNLILNFNEHLDASDVFDERSEPIENPDTLLVHFTQNLEKSPIDPRFGYLKRSTLEAIQMTKVKLTTFHLATVLTKVTLICGMTDKGLLQKMIVNFEF
uniref:Uncharacterized protein n=1 Tax=Romanomermis culicivorax TaxID=13658 RepID=A0A915KEE7_ROMCU